MEALLASSTTEENSGIPDFEELVLGELASATLEHLTEQPNQIDYRELYNHHTSVGRGYEHALWKAFNEHIGSSKKSLSPRIQRAISQLMEPEVVDPDGPDRPYTITMLYTTLRGDGLGGIIPFTLPRVLSYSMPKKQIERIRTEMASNFSEDEIKDITEIGRLMRKYIDKDMESIDKTLHSEAFQAAEAEFFTAWCDPYL